MENKELMMILDDMKDQYITSTRNNLKEFIDNISLPSIEKLTADFISSIRKNTGPEDIEVVISSFISTFGQIIVDNFNKKDGIRFSMQVGSQLTDSIAGAYNHFENGDDDYIMTKEVQF